jgi:3-deoxy-manno-octulosonate cytidylyltransferase (CMP-KDO synthetase)
MALRTLGVIPARLGSTRLPRKLLRPVAGRPLLAWTVEAARACPQLDALLVAADSEEIAALCRTLNVPRELTAPALPSGTDRIHAVAQIAPWDAYDLYVNLQGDEPLLRAEHIAALIAPFLNDPDENGPHEQIQITTLKTPCTPENIANPNAVKVVTTSSGRALYFSRATIPYHRDTAPRTTESEEPTTYFKHLGLYAYRRATLLEFPTLPASTLERTERLEQLRFLENDIAIHVVPTAHDTIGVDSEADLAEVEAILRPPREPQP